MILFNDVVIASVHNKLTEVIKRGGGDILPVVLKRRIANHHWR